MKNFMMILGACMLIGLASSCSKDKCITCTYVDTNGATVEALAGENNCGSSTELDLLEAAAGVEATFANGTDLNCTRN